MKRWFGVKIISRILMVFVLACTAWASETTERIFVGKLDGEVPIQMRLTIENNRVTGGIRYNQDESEYLLEGRLEENGDLFVQDKDNTGKIFAIFDGVFVTKHRIEGFWSRPEQDGKLIFEAESASAVKERRQQWKGVWRRTETAPFDWADLFINKVNSSSFHFQLEAGSGAVTRKASGTALIYGNEAVWTEPLSGEQIRLVWSGDTLKVEADDSRGNGVVFSGNYRPGFEPLPELSLLKLGVLSNSRQDQVFRKLTGEDYKLFTDSFQFVKHSIDDDGFGAVVRTGFLRGMAGFQEAIVMVTPENRFWAAVSDPELDMVKYYSNDDKFKLKMPQTIAEWTERVLEGTDMKVIYCSK